MRNAPNGAAKVLFVAAVLLSGPLLNCIAEEAGEFKTTGTVTATDWVASTITVDDTRFAVPSGARITKGSDDISLSDINNGDQVVIAYTKPGDGMPVANSIVVEYNGDMPI